ncbi:hypothetical protein VOLCADRAFT_105707 [Volvox carteri f. nagariensis]|uniref:Generative cell specific-1/HAP2 domain-containing protein n=1 Tax=Volvox carteri f. nagariensis TaxID=3068 RepID=D8U2H3_VOLCA|nr:uncharacterized protein VOLCADRAFT_105707 [Volvox carteri f. nagariensis]EFJ46133.1 hypothetical protein VOLCADRAFT_105707 [Volvox carteri f. nagariensis]|eukprot:XP_002952883.1 hypothetical protein VOLCADRAFT_105707 [Volvox carteri f. nagariensis]
MYTSMHITARSRASLLPPSGICPCPCNAAVDEGCSCRDLAEPLVVEYNKEALYVSHMLNYTGTYNYKPYEVLDINPLKLCEVVAVSMALHISSLAEAGRLTWRAGNSCGLRPDAPTDDWPQCGWQKVDGKRVPDSQGFCCWCDRKVIWDQTAVNARTRANKACDENMFPELEREPVSAHCLRLDDQWYRGYNLRPGGTLQFGVRLEVHIPTAGKPASMAYVNGTLRISKSTVITRSESLDLTLAGPLVTTSNKMTSARLLGDLSSYAQVPDLGTRALMIPRADFNETELYPGDSVPVNGRTWMMVNRTMVTYDGLSCDKIGTSYTAFRNQQNACFRTESTCLRNQLKDLFEGDQKRIGSGMTPLYLLSQFNGVNGMAVDAIDGAIYLRLPIASQPPSVMLTVSADTVQMTTALSPGKLSNLRMCEFGSTTSCGSLGFITRGHIFLSVANMGLLPADYIIVVSDCSLNNVWPIEARMITVNAGQTVNLSPPIPIYMNDTTTKERSCAVQLYDATGKAVDRQKLTFDATASKGLQKPSRNVNATNATNCDEVCANPAGVSCFIENDCPAKMGRFLGILAAILAGITLMVLACKYSWFSKLYGCCCNDAGCMLGGGRSRRGGLDLGYGPPSDGTMPPMHLNNMYSAGDGPGLRPSSTESLYNPWGQPTPSMANMARYESQSGGRLQSFMGAFQPIQRFSQWTRESIRSTQRTAGTTRQSWFNPAAWSMRPSNWSRAGSVTSTLTGNRAAGVNQASELVPLPSGISMQAPPPPGASQSSLDMLRSSQWLQMPQWPRLNPALKGISQNLPPTSQAESVTGSIADNGRVTGLSQASLSLPQGGNASSSLDGSLPPPSGQRVDQMQGAIKPPLQSQQSAQNRLWFKPGMWGAGAASGNIRAPGSRVGSFAGSVASSRVTRPGRGNSRQAPGAPGVGVSMAPLDSRASIISTVEPSADQDLSTQKPDVVLRVAIGALCVPVGGHEYKL